MSARVVISALGSRGDVQPILGLARGLVDRGHRVRIATHLRFEGIVRDAGLDFFATGVGFDSAELWTGRRGLRLFETRDPVLYSLRLFRRVRPFIERHFEECLRACADADLICGLRTVEMASASVAEARGLPFVDLFLSPPDPRFFHSTLGARIAPVLGDLGCRVLGQRRTLAEVREKVLGLGRSRGARDVPRLGLVGVSPSIVSRPDDWDPAIAMTGYWFTEQPGFTPPAALAAFLEAGRAPVCVGFGSMPDRDPEALTEIVLAGIAKARCRAIVLTGGGAIRATHARDVMMLPEAPHEWLLPRVSTIVHHGGAGTTAAALRAGIPSIVMPRFGDQAFWGMRLAALGAGTAPLDRRRLDASTFAAALDAATASDVRARARGLGAAIRAENGVGAAADRIEALLARAH